MASVESVSPARRLVYEALVELTEDGWPASVRDVQAVTGHASTSTVHVLLHGLERDGLVERHPRNERCGWRVRGVWFVVT